MARLPLHRITTLQGKPLGLILNEFVVNALKYAFPMAALGSQHRISLSGVSLGTQSDVFSAVSDRGI